MAEEVKKIGEMFKSKRKELNLSLKEVENATSIRISHLEAIEEGKEDKFLSSVYLIGFIRQYANFLGIDGDKIIEDHPNVYQSKRKKQEFSYGIGTLEVRGSVGGGLKWLPNLMWATLSVIIMVAAYYLTRYLRMF